MSSPGAAMSGTAARAPRVARPSPRSSPSRHSEAGCMSPHVVSSKNLMSALARSAATSFALLLTVTTAALAQASGTITGRVTDASSGAPVPDAQVRVMGLTTGVMTRLDGSYRLVVAPGRYELRVSRIGYAAARDSVFVDAAVTVTKDFRLDQTGLSLDQVVVIGSRRADRTVTEAPVPVDVLSAEDIQRTGLTETSQIIQMLAPSFNFPRPSVNDGTDHVRPATLRGLGPDQVLVLINGKRRHNTALVHVNQSVGRGSTSVDFNAIPANAIDRIEILRDGAAAQYGSDAIAGVINIILKSGPETSISATVGQRYSNTYGPTTNAANEVTFGKRDYRDGRVLQVDGNIGWALREDGFVHVSAEFRDRERTNRARADVSDQCLAGDSRCQ